MARNKRSSMRYALTEVETHAGVRVARVVTVGLYLVTSIALVGILGSIVLSLAFPSPRPAPDVADSSNTATIAWTVLGNDGVVGPPVVFDVRYSQGAISDTTWTLAIPVAAAPVPLPPGSRQSMSVTGLEPGTRYTFSVKSVDDQGNRSALQSIGTRQTTSVGCVPQWSCTGWSRCIEGSMSRSCIDIAKIPCENGVLQPLEQQTCTSSIPTGTACTEYWSCTSWTACRNGSRTRTCQDDHRCATDANSPVIAVSCSNGDNVPDNPSPSYLAFVGVDRTPTVTVMESTTGRTVSQFPVDVSIGRSPQAVGTGDVNGDGKTDVVIGTDVGSAPIVSVYSLSGLLEDRFLAFPGTLRTGLTVGVGDVNGDGQDDIVTAPAGNYPSMVRVFAYNRTAERFTAFAFFTPFESWYRGGVRIAVGDLDRDGFSDVVVTPATGGYNALADVYEYDLQSGVMQERTAFYTAMAPLPGGTIAAIGDVNGDGQQEIMTVPGSGIPYVQVFAFEGDHVTRLTAFQAGSMSIGSGGIATRDINHDGLDEVVALRTSNGTVRNAAYRMDPMTGTFGLFSGSSGRYTATEDLLFGATQ